MDLRKALDQLEDIHGQMARTEVYRSYRAFPMAGVGLLGILAGVFQERILGPQPGVAFVVYWSAIAAVGLAQATAWAVTSYFRVDNAAARGRTRRVLAQMMAALLAGFVATVAMLRADPAMLPWMPGLWALFFAVGSFASRPYLPRGLLGVGFYFLAAGATLLDLAPSGASLSPWAMPLSFGVGHLLVAGLLYLNLERKS